MLSMALLICGASSYAGDKITWGDCSTQQWNWSCSGSAECVKLNGTCESPNECEDTSASMCAAAGCAGQPVISSAIPLTHEYVTQ